MSFKPVEAVFFWRYFESPYRAAYGRLRDGTTKYTKDYFQSSGEQWATLDRILQRGEGEKIAVEYRWPEGNSRIGEYRKATDDRGQLAWPTSDAPTPWKVGDPQANPAITVPGNPGLATEADADAELVRIEALGLEPWAVAVKLYDEPGVLHPRLYLGRPPAGLEKRSIEVLPAAVRAGMRDLRGNAGGGAVIFGRLRAPELVNRIIEALMRDPNVLLVGPPGTGKTVAMEDLRSLFEGRGVAGFNPERWDDAWMPELLEPAAGRKALALVFHPSYAYEDFVAGLVPRTQNGTFSLVARPGPLLSMAHWASGAGRAGLLILDEFNRGPAAAIFGDTLALLDVAKRDNPVSGQRGAAIQRPHPHEEMEVAAEYANAQGRNVGAEVRLPVSLWIVAALNSTDRSVAPLDAALRRRFAVLSVAPDYGVLARRFGIDRPELPSAFAPSTPEPADWTADDVKQLAIRVLWALNERINLVLGHDFLLGQALLWPVEGDTAADAGKSLCRAFDERIAATLRLTFVDQDEALAAVLKAGAPPAPGVRPNAVPERVAYWVAPSSDLESVASPRVEMRESAAMVWSSAAKALIALL